MRQSRFSEEQVIAILWEHEAGAKTANVRRRHGNSSAAFFKWKGKYGGLDVSEARRLKLLEQENARLKWLLHVTDSTQVWRKFRGSGHTDNAFSCGLSFRIDPFAFIPGIIS